MRVVVCRDHPIAPVMLYDANVATKFADEMLKEGIYVIGFSYPVRYQRRRCVAVAHSTPRPLVAATTGTN